MHEQSGDNKYGFETGDNEEWFEVHSSAITNTNPASMVYVTIDTTPICPNMTDREFRKTILSLRDDAVTIIQQRQSELATWSLSSQDRVRAWFGSSDENLRQTLIIGLSALKTVMNGLTATNFIRPDPERDRAVGCTPNLRNLGEVAHVCRPDTATHTIAINTNFCQLPQKSAGKLSSMQLTLVHECTHFMDTFGTLDYPDAYGRTACTWFARNHSDLAINNADSIAWYVLARDE
ncbi:M35 family metallo-endopeptidase [Paraburkholderia bannensis]|uniref:M35 family metallo-endopeptidase n=1 Tax=Paraburkholderia bannensis TaxID=765414 RepID=UPI002AB7115E|nr:M35 family metallo-endopeptidase [Paraburkholderia bannensis]